MATVIKKISGVDQSSIKYLNKIPNLSNELYRSYLLNSTNLVAYYRLENSALTIDNGPNGYTLTNNNSVGEASGKFGGCADFGTSNTNKKLTIANNFGIDGGAISMSGWVKIRTEITVDNTVYNLFSSSSTGTDVSYQLLYHRQSGVNKLWFQRYKEGVGRNYIEYNTSLGTSNWYFFTCTYDITNLKFYINGSLNNTVAGSGNGTSNIDSGFSIGGSLTAASQYSNAYIDDVSIFNRALTATEVSNLYNTNIKKFMGVSNI